MAPETTVIETPIVETPAEAASVADHAAQFSPAAQQTEADLVAKETPEETQARHHSADQKREKETGKFEPGKQRHRAQSQKAGPEDVPRIRELTTRVNSERERAERAERALAQLRTSGGSPKAIEKAEAKVDTARAAAGSVNDPEPNENDAKYGGDWMAFVQDHGRWVVRDENRKIRASESEAQRQTETKAQHETAMRAFQERYTKTREKYADFDEVMGRDNPIETGSPVELFLLEDDNGPDVMYHLASHGEELNELLAMTPLQQLKRLSLLSQRYDQASSSSAQAGVTGSAAGRIVKPLPKPPNPVRTEAQRGTDTAETGPASSIADHMRRFGKR